MQATDPTGPDVGVEVAAYEKDDAFSARKNRWFWAVDFSGRLQAPPNPGRRIGLSTASGMCAWTTPPFIDHWLSLS